jgi:ribonuclease III
MADRDPVRPAVPSGPLVSDAAEGLFEILQHRFADPALLAAALTHASAAAARSGGETFDRLEFLGDRVLGLVVAEMLLAAHPGEPEGPLARRFASLVRADTLASVAERIGLDRYLHAARNGDAPHEPGVLADLCEAIIGAIYLDAGLEPARRFVESNWRPLLADARPEPDAKTALQEWAQSLGRPAPVYETLTQAGLAHAPSFEVRVRVQGEEEAVGHGRSKRAAEQDAAARLLRRLGLICAV